MLDSENDIFFCICGKKVDKPGSCGEQYCIEGYNNFQEEIDNFFKKMEKKGVWKSFQEFETFDTKLQIGIFFELEDELMLLFLQALGKQKVLDLVQHKSDAFRYRFLELMDPLLEESLVDEFKNIQDLDKEELKEFLLQIIDIILQSVEENH